MEGIGPGHKLHPHESEHDENGDPYSVGDMVDKVGCYQFGDEGWADICEEHDGLRESWTDEVESSGEDDDIEHIINAA